MVTAKKVMWAESAKDDLKKIYSRIAGKSVEHARARVEAILAKIAELNTSYLNGLPEPLLKKEKDLYRFVHVGFYKVVYSTVEDTVVVETIYHTRQDPVI